MAELSEGFLMLQGYLPKSTSKPKREYWNKCDICGKFIAYKDFEPEGKAVRHMVTPDSEYSREAWETICTKCITEGQ
jgi:hypothetical protein